MARNRLNFISVLLIVFFTLTTLAGCTRNNTPWGSGPATSNSGRVPPAPTAPPVMQPASLPPANIPTSGLNKVALLLPLTGKASDTGQAMLNAAQLAMFDLGSQGFELLPKDTAGTPDTARLRAEEAIREGSKIILGPLFAADSKMVGPIALQSGINVISFSTDTSVAGANSFVLGFLPQSQIKRIIDFAAGKGMPRIALIAPDDQYGNAITNAFDTYIRSRNLLNAGILRYKGATPSLDQIKNFAARKPVAPYGTIEQPFDAVLIATSGPNAGKISEMLSQSGISNTQAPRLGTGLWDSADVAKIPSLQGSFYAASSPSLRQKFENKYFSTYGQQPPRIASLAYDATALAIVLTRQNQGFGRGALTNPNGFSGLDGIFRLQNDGLNERGLAVLEIRNNSTVVAQDAPSSFLNTSQ